MSYNISDSFEVLALLSAKDRHWILGERNDDSLVAEALVAQVFEVCIFFEFNELFDIVLIKWVDCLDSVDVFH